MKKILILAYDFPPYVSVGGLRPFSWYKHFKQFDIHPIVVTRQWTNKYGNHLDYIAEGESKQTIIEETEFGTLIKTAYKPNLANRILLKYGENKFKFIRKLVSVYYEILQYFFIIGPKSNLYKEAESYLKKNKVDVIIATGDPFVLFKYATILSKKHNIPWIADYRDLWSHVKPIQKNYFLKLIHTRNEIKFVSTANIIISVSEFLKHKISNLIKLKPHHIIINGFDSDILAVTDTLTTTKKALNIAFAGTIYEWNPLHSFLKIVEQLVSEKPSIKIKINFYGVNLIGSSFKSDLIDIVKNNYPKLLDCVIIHPKLSNIILSKELMNANVLLLFNYYSYLGTKIFDYIAIKKNILFCYTNDAEALILKNKYYDIEEIEFISNKLQEELILETNSGYLIKNSEHLYQKLIELNNEFMQNGYIKCNTINAEKYSRKNQVEKLANIIKELTLQ